MDCTGDSKRDGDIQQGGGRVFFCDGYDRGVTRISHSETFYLFPPGIVAVIYRRSSVQQQPAHSDDVGHNGWEAPFTTEPPAIHRPPVGIDAALLGPGSPLAP